MARVTVDFSDVQDFEAIPKAEYSVVIVKPEYREAQEADKYDYINLEMDITEGEFKGRKLWMILSLSPKALWRMKDVFENLGIYQDEIEIDYDEDTKIVTEPELTGMPGVAVVSQRTYEGRIQNQVDALLSIDDTPKKREPAGKATNSRKPAAKKATEAKPKATITRRFK